MLDMSWLAQANACLGVINTLGRAVTFDHAFKGTLLPNGTTRTVHLFIAPITAKHEGSRVRVNFDCSKSDSYWSLDPAGTTRLSTAECTSLGLPRLRFVSLVGGNYWQEYHYSAICEFLRAKRIDPYSYELLHLLGLPLVEQESFSSTYSRMSGYYIFQQALAGASRRLPLVPE
ncbi:hypothetical protein B0H14DRAFT_2904746 [Mycena olivaceomarginata]|nr:hypothetical protein B0H14DRAFT_2904746 [Mycena olivaceomarginata]